jgi:hypothetical protein
MTINGKKRGVGIKKVQFRGYCSRPNSSVQLRTRYVGDNKKEDSVVHDSYTLPVVNLNERLKFCSCDPDLNIPPPPPMPAKS